MEYPQRSLRKEEERTSVPVSTEEKTGDVWATLLVYKCTECALRVREEDRERHEEEHHEGEAQGGEAEPVQYQCLVCDFNIDWRLETIRKHLASHHLTLEDYRTQFEEPIALQIKEQTEMIKKEQEKKTRPLTKRSEVNNLQCNDCGKQYTTNLALDTFITSIKFGQDCINTCKSCQKKIIKSTK